MNMNMYMDTRTAVGNGIRLTLARETAIGERVHATKIYKPKLFEQVGSKQKTTLPTVYTCNSHGRSERMRKRHNPQT